MSKGEPAHPAWVRAHTARASQRVRVRVLYRPNGQARRFTRIPGGRDCWGGGGGEVEMEVVTVISSNEIARTSEYEGASCSVLVEINYVRE